MVPFEYGAQGQVLSVGEPFQSFQEPSEPLSPAITAITGITDAMVLGHHIDPETLAAFVAGAALIVAHNAAFDRRFAERLSEVFVPKPWACSLAEIDWSAEGFEGAKLAYLAMGGGGFSTTVIERCERLHGRHRAFGQSAAPVGP